MAAFDGHWHFACLDLASQVRDQLFKEGVSLTATHRVLSLRLGAPIATATFAPDAKGTFMLDEFSITSLVRGL